MIYNDYKIVIYDSEECVEFITKGKYILKVLVDKKIWFDYLSEHSWTGQKIGNYFYAKASINNHSKALHKVIIENTENELDCWGTTIDHKNNDPLDNRKKNLRIYNTSILNTTNIKSKHKINDMQYVYPQIQKNKETGVETITAYKTHYNIGGKPFFKNFSVKDYGNAEEAKKAAKQYRDDEIYKDREMIMDSLKKKCRDIEFERGLRDKLNANELDEVIDILKKYQVL